MRYPMFVRRQSWSSGKCMLVVPKIRTKGYGARSFLYSSATLWNELYDDRLTEASSVSIFKGRLKTHLFNCYLSPVSQPHSFCFCLCIYHYYYVAWIQDFISFNVCFICILNCILFVYKLFILYVCVTERFELFQIKVLYEYLLLLLLLSFRYIGTSLNIQVSFRLNRSRVVLDQLLRTYIYYVVETHAYYVLMCSVE